jgi:hypothetical protein
MFFAQKMHLCKRALYFFSHDLLRSHFLRRKHSHDAGRQEPHHGTHPVLPGANVIKPFYSDGRKNKLVFDYVIFSGYLITANKPTSFFVINCNNIGVTSMDV